MSELHEVQRMADGLIARHLGSGWSFAFDNAKKRAGACDYRRSRITASRYLAARYTTEQVEQVLLHEIAHAIAGHAAAHGPVWLTTARRLGYTGGRTHRWETADELAGWIAVCPSGHTMLRHRRPSAPTSCGRCSPTFDRRHLLTWTRREITAADRRAALTPR